RADVRSPRQRLVGNSDAAPRGAFAELVQLRRRSRVVVNRLRADVGTHQHHWCAQLGERVELAFGAVQVAAEGVVRDGLEIAEWLEQVDRQAEVVRERAHLAWLAAEVDQIVLEQLDGAEMSGGDGAQLFIQGSAQRDRRYRASHATSSTVLPGTFLDNAAAASASGGMDRTCTRGWMVPLLTRSMALEKSRGCS